MAKTVLITGSTDGIGKHLAKKLASEGHQVILHGRNAEKLEAALKEVKAVSLRGRVSAYLADFSKMEDVYHLVEEIKADFDEIDVLFNNAGLFSGPERRANEENVELTFMLSVLVPYILIKELQPLLDNARAARVINTSSYMHHFADAKDLDFGFEKKYSPKLAYDTSKLYVIWLTRYFARQFYLQESKIIVNSYHPGLIATKMVAGDGDKKTSKNPVTNTLLSKAKGLDEGIQTGYYLALSPEVAELSGSYFDDKQVKNVSEKGFTYEKSQALVDYCEERIKDYQSKS